jgi:hypothetical protein
VESDPEDVVLVLDEELEVELLLVELELPLVELLLPLELLLEPRLVLVVLPLVVPLEASPPVYMASTVMALVTG